MIKVCASKPAWRLPMGAAAGKRVAPLWCAWVVVASVCAAGDRDEPPADEPRAARVIRIELRPDVPIVPVEVVDDENDSDSDEADDELAEDEKLLILRAREFRRIRAIQLDDWTMGDQNESAARQ